MERFAILIQALEMATSEERAVLAIQNYLSKASDEDAAWAIHLLLGRRVRKVCTLEKLRNWALESAEIPVWLFRECEQTLSDPAEVYSLLCGSRHDVSEAGEGASDFAKVMRDLTAWYPELSEEQLGLEVQKLWRELSCESALILHQLLLGKWKSPVSSRLVEDALAELTGRSRSVVAMRLERFHPTAEHYLGLISSETGSDQASTEADDESWALPSFSEIREWKGPELPLMAAPAIEWAKEGERAFLLRNAKGAFLWSQARGWITKSFPEIRQAGLTLPEGTLIEGFLEPGGQALEARDLLMHIGQERVKLSLEERRGELERMLQGRSRHLRLVCWHDVLSPEEIEALRSVARDHGARGIRLRSRQAPYGASEYEWPCDALSMSAVLLYAHSSQDEYTFAVWKEDQLVPVVRAPIELSEREIQELDRWVRKNTREKFGPVRSVEPVHVFEIAFSQIVRSSRHKSGVVLKTPKVLRWLKDRGLSAIASLQSLHDQVDSHS